MKNLSKKRNTYLFLSLFLFSTIQSIYSKQLVSSFIVIKNDTTFIYSCAYIEKKANQSLETKYHQEDSNWTPLSQTEWEYENEECIQKTERIYKENNWIDHYQIRYNYSNNTLEEENHYVIKDEKWVNTLKVKSEYKNLKLEIRKEYRAENEEMILKKELKCEYLTDQQIASTLQTYHFPEYTLDYHSRYEYNNNGTIKSIRINEKINQQEWNYKTQTNWYYPVNSELPITIIISNWNSKVSNWENSQKTKYEYDENANLISETYTKWENQHWSNLNRYNYVYSKENNVSQKQMCEYKNNQWRNIYTMFYSNDIENKPTLIETKYEFWGGTPGSFVSQQTPFLFNERIRIENAQKIEINYQDHNIDSNGVDEIKIKPALLVYPNPSAGIFYIQMDQEITKWTLYDLQGKMIKTINKSQNQKYIDLTEMNLGVYMLRAETEEGKSNYQKIIKTK